MTDGKRDLTESGAATDALTVTVQEDPWVYQTAGGGWMLADNEHADRLEVRFALSEQGRLEPVELRMDARRAIDSTVLRSLPLTAMETLANSVVRESLTSRLDEPGPEPWWRPASLPPGKLWDPPATRRPNPFKRYALSAGPKPDHFYEQVATAYSRLAVKSNRPAVELAKKADVPITTVHRWVKEARRRGFLPPGQKGRRG